MTLDPRRTSPTEMSNADTVKLMEVYQSVMRGTAEGRETQLATYLADLPQKTKSFLLGRIDFQGDRSGIANRIVETLKTERFAKTALGIFIQGLANETDEDDFDWLGSLFLKYELDASVDIELSKTGWQGDDSSSPLEVLLQEDPFQPVSFLRQAAKAADAVVRIRIAPEVGTGFLVGERLVMTCHHVIARPDQLQRAMIEFNYEEDEYGYQTKVQRTKGDPGGLFFTSPKDKLDVTVFEIKPPKVPSDVAPLRLHDGSIEVSENVSIIQHPLGEFKKVALRNNLVEFRNDDVLQYTTSTRKGSSGSPVFDEQMRVVAVHNKGDLKLPEPGSNLRYARNEGSRAGAILAAIRAENAALYDRLTKTS